jgi:hydrogenase maturation factor
MMEVGKLKNEVLGEIVLSEIHTVRDDILIRPNVGEDCTAVAFGDLACVLTTDPITGTDKNIGQLAVNVCLNDIASSGAEAVGIMLTLLCPETTTQETIGQILREANETANQYDVEIIGGHTEITNAVNRIIVSATALGRTQVNRLIKTSGAEVGDYIYLTKTAGLEGTAIIVSELENELSEVLSKSEIQEAKDMFKQISVINEGKIGVRIGATAMHDATEGGILGAIHELCEASGKGCKVKADKIAIHPVTEKLCEYYNINPLKLISSGTMVICMPQALASELEKALLDFRIEYSRVGVITEERDKKLIMGDASVEEIFDYIESPDADELYKVIK